MIDRCALLATFTLAFFAPLAERVGLPAQRARLEEQSFRALDPVVHAALSLEHRADDLDALRIDVGRWLASEGLEAEVTSRVKSAWSVHRKMVRKELPVEGLMDRLGVRARVETVEEAYEVVAAVHQRFTPIAGTFKDYVVSPKPNGYQSLHTAVVVPGLGPVEFQVRTHAMHEVAEHGDAAHWRYKLAA